MDLPHQRVHLYSQGLSAYQQILLWVFLLPPVVSDKGIPYLLTYSLLQRNKLIANGLIFPLSKVQLTPCHFLYADDILLFLRGYKPSLIALNQVLGSYQCCSGQAINLRKSKLFLGKCSARKRRQIQESTNLHDSPLSLKYLGAPLVLGMPKKHHFNQLIDRFISKLAGCKSRFLSFAGRRVLIRHVFGSLATLIALVLLVPKSEINHLDRLMKHFLWSVDPTHSKRHSIR